MLRGLTGVGAVSAGLGTVSAQSGADAGTVQWSFSTGDAVNSSPTVIDGTVFVGSHDNNVYALDATDGTQQWAFETGDRVLSSPAVSGGMVFIGSLDGTIYGLDQATGDVVWTVNTNETVISSPTVVGGTVYVGSHDTNVYALNAADGTEQWRFETDGQVSASPTVVDGTVYIGSGGGTLYALNAGDGTKQWAFDAATIRASPTVAGGRVFVGTRSVTTENAIYALDASDGTELWRYKAEGSWSSPTVADGTVFVGTGSVTGAANKTIHALSATDGTTKWALETPSWVRSSPTVAGGTVFIASGDTRVHVLDAGDGTTQWHFDTEESFFSSPIVVDGTMYIGGGDGKVYAVQTDVDGSSNGSRVLLRTLGHHHGQREDVTAGTTTPVDEGRTPQPTRGFRDTFTEQSVGEVPDSWVVVGPQPCDLVDVDGGNGLVFRLQGVHGGCQRAIARRPVDLARRMLVACRIRVGNGQVGCHDDTWSLLLRTQRDSETEAPGESVPLIQCLPDGTVTAVGTQVGTYTVGQWVDCAIEYVQTGDGTVTYTCQIGDGPVQTVTRQARPFESRLSVLELRTGDYTIYCDGISAQPTDGTAFSGGSGTIGGGGSNTSPTGITTTNDDDGLLMPALLGGGGLVGFLLLFLVWRRQNDDDDDNQPPPSRPPQQPPNQY